MEKISGLRDMWQGFLDIFRSKDERVQRRVDYHFSPKASSDKWRKLVNNSHDPKFVSGLAKHPDADSKLILHAQSMGDLSRGKPVGKIKSSTTPGRTYEIRKLSEGRLGCQCGDWRYKGSVNPGYECKHIKAHRAGQERAA
jgi:hypothetical protein